MSPPALVPDRHHLRRQLRYVALNPCRAGLCADPLEWHWSTYRDAIGATASPWVSHSRLATALGERERDFRVRFHDYVSGDPSVAIDGTPSPRPALPKALAEEGIIEILSAAAAALRLPPADVRTQIELRRLFVHMARRQGWSGSAVLARICGVSTRAVQLMLKEAPPEGLGAAALCLGDPRLRLFAERERFGATPRG